MTQDQTPQQPQDEQTLRAVQRFLGNHAIYLSGKTVKQLIALASQPTEPVAQREATQRARMQKRFESRALKPATADFDLPAASGGVVLPAPVGERLTDEQRLYFDQAEELLEEYADVLDKAGNNSVADGARASAHVIRAFRKGESS